jgi:hypothetical protein
MLRNPLDEDQAASELGVSVEYLRQLRADRSGPPYYLGLMRRVRYDRAELVEWAESVADTLWQRVEPSQNELPAPQPAPSAPAAPAVDPYKPQPRPKPRTAPRRQAPSQVAPPPSEGWRPTVPVEGENPEHVEAVASLERPDQGLMEDLRAQGRLKLREDGSYEILPPRGGNWECAVLDEAGVQFQQEKGLRLGGPGHGLGRWADDVPAEDPQAIEQDIRMSIQTGQPRRLPDGRNADGSVFSQMATEGPAEERKVIVVPR